MGVPFAAAERFVVEKSHSFVGVEVHASPPHHFTVEVTDYEAEIEVEDQEPRSARFDFHFADLKSGNGRRDRKMQHWMETDTYPDGRFELERVENSPEGGLRGIGLLYMHGVSQPVVVDFAWEERAGELHFVGESQINYSGWNLGTISLLFFKVSPELHVRFDLAGRIVQ